MKQCVVTGSTGCLGMALCRLLLEKKFKVIGLGRNAKMGKILKDMGVDFKTIDLTEKNKLIKNCRNANFIFHCAALSSAWGAYQDFYEANVKGTQHIIAATPKTARLIHVSSPSVYFNFKSQYNIKEDQPLPKRAANYYIETKRSAEKLVLNAHYNQNLNTIIIRPRGIFGPYDRAILPRLMALYRKGKMPLIGDGHQLVDISYVDNVAQSLIDAALAPKACNGRIYNITNDEPKPFRELLEQVFTAFNLKVQFEPYSYQMIKPIAYLLNTVYKLPFISSEPPITPYTAGVMALGQTLDISQAKKDLHYQPTISIEEGIKRYVAWSQQA